MDNLWYRDGKKRDTQQVVADLLQEDVTYEFIATVAQCPLEMVKDIAARLQKQKVNRSDCS